MKMVVAALGLAAVLGACAAEQAKIVRTEEARSGYASWAFKSSTTRMGDAPTPDAAKTGSVSHRGSGKVTDVDPTKGRVELDHGPIPSMKWPAMKMGFAVKEKGELARLKKGDTVEFELRGEADKEGNYVIERITPTLTGSKP